MNNEPVSVLIDFEAMGSRDTSIVLDLAAVVFKDSEVDSFSDLVNDKSRVFYAKFDISSQEGRTIDRDTYNWWTKQNETVRSILKPSAIDVRLREGIEQFEDFLHECKVDPKESLIYSRGTSYDYPIMENIVRSLGGLGRGSGMFPGAFWNQRDVRTAIAYAMLQPSLKKLPVAKGTFPGFIKHNSIHDVCKDAILLQTALAYGRGTLEMPNLDDVNLFDAI